jgi:hypothetical protein
MPFVSPAYLRKEGEAPPTTGSAGKEVASPVEVRSGDGILCQPHLERAGLCATATILSILM